MRPLALTSMVTCSLTTASLKWILTPNRSDCLVIIGLARETGLMNNLDVCMPDIQSVAAVHNDQVAVHLAAPEVVCALCGPGCARR